MFIQSDGHLISDVDVEIECRIGQHTRAALSDHGNIVLQNGRRALASLLRPGDQLADSELGALRKGINQAIIAIDGVPLPQTDGASVPAAVDRKRLVDLQLVSHFISPFGFSS
jgi:hypothetical protein